jgi:putative flippase GtrA
MISFLKKLPVSIVKYISVGLISVAVDYGMLLILYRLLDVPLEVATAVAFIIGLVVNFILNRMWSFDVKADRRGTIRQAVLYGLLVLINTLFTVAVVGFASNNLHILPEISKPVCVLLTTMWNYILYKKVIFKQSGETTV